MGYDVHITRKEFLWDEEVVNNISLDEWLRYVDSDEELELTNSYLIKIPGVDNTLHNVPGFCNWSGHSKMKGDSQPWFDYRDGYISTKNPDDETISKMIHIANTLNAKVQGDDGEFYDEAYLANQRKEPTQTKNIKPWWRFW